MIKITPITNVNNDVLPEIFKELIPSFIASAEEQEGNFIESGNVKINS